MNFAVLASPLLWMARHWLRFLTGLAIIAVALGPVRVAPAVAVAVAPVLTAEAAPAAGAQPQRPVIEPGEDRTIVEPAPIAVAQAPTRVRRQRPAPVTQPASADVAPAGQRAPPAAASVAVPV